MTKEQAKIGIAQNQAAYIAAIMHKRQFSVYVAANHGSLFARAFGLNN